MKKTLVVALLLLAFPVAAQAGRQPLVKTVPTANGEGIIDYGRGFIEVTATSAVDMRRVKSVAQAEPVALRTARRMAYAMLSETVGHIQIDAETTYREALMEATTLRAETQGVVRGARIVKEECQWVEQNRMNPGVLEPMGLVTLRLPLAGQEGLGHLVDKHIPPSKFKAASSPESHDRGAESASAPVEKGAQRGLVVDLGDPGLGYEAALRLYLLDETGGLIREHSLGPGKRSFEYVSSVEEATGSLAAEPLVVKAKAVGGPGEIIISKADAEAVRRMEQSVPFTGEARIYLLVK